MSEYWWSWKLHRVLFLHHSSGGWDRGEGQAYTVFPWREAPFSIFRIPVFCAESQKGDQSHFEALGASFVCEGCEVLPKWLCQFFKTHLQLTLSGSAFIVFGAQVRRHMIESCPLWRGSFTIKSWAFDSHICYSTEPLLYILKMSWLICNTDTDHWRKKSFWRKATNV